jgi:hypothetical protein
MQIVGIYVTLAIPDSMTPEQACAEVKTSIGFGHPEVKLQYVLPVREEDPTSQ